MTLPALNLVALGPRRGSSSRTASSIAPTAGSTGPPVLGMPMSITRTAPAWRFAARLLGRCQRQHIDLAAPGAQVARGDEAVTPVVALSTDDHDAARGRALGDEAGKAGARAFHQLERRDRELLDRPAVELALLR